MLIFPVFSTFPYEYNNSTSRTVEDQSPSELETRTHGARLEFLKRLCTIKTRFFNARNSLPSICSKRLPLEIGNLTSVIVADVIYLSQGDQPQIRLAVVLFFLILAVFGSLPLSLV